MWLVGVVSRRWMWLVGVVVRRYSYYLSLLLLYLFFFAAASLLFVHLKKMFFVLNYICIYNYCNLMLSTIIVIFNLISV